MAQEVSCSLQPVPVLGMQSPLREQLLDSDYEDTSTDPVGPLPARSTASLNLTALFIFFKYFVSFSLDFVKRFFHFLFKDLYLFQIVSCKAFFFCLSSAEVFRACCGRAAGFHWGHTALACIDYVFTLEYKHLGGNDYRSRQ